MAMTLYEFIVDTYNEHDLWVLCEDEKFQNDKSQKATSELSETMPKNEKVRRLINFCKRHALYNILWDKVKQENKTKWKACQMPENDSGNSVNQVINLQPTFERPLSIFICHATTDRPNVIKLYDYLREKGMKPWLDSENLLPGQRMETEIPKAIITSDIVAICLSKNSINKQGYVQTEMKFAVKQAMEIPEDHIFIIPIRLDECIVPDSLKPYKSVDLFENDGYLKLMKSINLRGQQLGQ